MLRAIEDGMSFEQFMPADPAVAIRDVSAEASGRASIDLAGGGQITALDLLARLLDQVRDRADDPDLVASVELWERVIRALADRRWELIDTDID